MDGRLRLLDRLRAPLSDAYSALATVAEPVVAEDYHSEWFEPGVGALVGGAGRIEALAAGLRTRLEAMRSRELDRGVTLNGPQRDEWELVVNGLPARTHASQGEQRSLALALRLAGHAVVTEVTGESPVLLLDDVFSELDPRRSAALVGHLPSGQAIVTTAGLLPPELAAQRIVHVRAGALVA